jgi:arsenate reductase-like glutaredoxin family protein
VTVRETVDARKQPHDRASALAVARGAKKLVVAKGKKVVRHDLTKEKLSDAELAALVVGPTGALRAPAIRTGDTLLVGFHEEGFQEAIR